MYAPFYAKAANLPESYQIGNPRKFDTDAAWWVFDFVANWSRLNFQRMCQVDILPLQKEHETELFRALGEANHQIAWGSSDAAAQMLAFSQEATDHMLDRWRDMGQVLVAKYANGYVNPGPHDRRDPASIGYPADWLARTDYANGPTSYDMKVERG